MFLARVEWLPVTSHSLVTSQTDKSKISIMMIYTLYHNNRSPNPTHITCVGLVLDRFLDTIIVRHLSALNSIKMLDRHK